MNIAIILSAGSGSRFKSDVPKQFLELNGSSVICHSLDKFNKAKFIDAIVLVSHPDHMAKAKQLASGYNKVICVVEGGLRRQDSVFNALKWVKDNSKCSKVWVHDSARPVFTEKLLQKLYEASQAEKAVIPAVPSQDTLKEIKDGYVVRTVDRENLFRVQTPQVFDFSILLDAYVKLTNAINATDDAFLMEHFGVKISVVEGEDCNIKLTYPTDIKLAEILIGSSKKI